MSFGHGSLSVTPLWEKDRVVLVPAIEAVRLRTEGEHREVEPGEALRYFDEVASRNRSRVREFVLSARLAGGSLRDIDDSRLCALVRAAIRDGRVKGVRAAAKGMDQAASGRAERRRLVRAIASRGRLGFSGRRYQLVDDVDLARLRERDSYEVVGGERAREILSALAADPGVEASLGALLLEAREKLTRDWRPPVGQPDGLILLRWVPNVASVVREPAITPSQLRALAAAGWIEIEFVDPLGQPVPVVCRLELPDGTRLEASDDQHGVVARRNFSPGMCRLSLLSLDAARWTVKA